MDDDEREEPISELGGLEIEPSPDFTVRLRRRIERREATNHLLWQWWHLPLAVLMAFLDMTFALFGSDRSDRGGST